MDYYSSGKVVHEKCIIFGRSNLESVTILAQSPPKNDHFFRDMQTRQFHPYTIQHFHITPRTHIIQEAELFVDNNTLELSSCNLLLPW